MPKLHQVVALVSGKKTRLEKEFGDWHKISQKADLFHGITRTYKPVEEGGETLPSEKKNAQSSVYEILGQVRNTLTDIVDLVATQEVGNTTAKANVVVDGNVLLKDIPVCVMLYLEKQLEDIRTFVEKLPTLDPAESWKKNVQGGYYELEEAQKTVRTKKVQKPIVLYDATDKHPAQTQLITEDVNAGVWTTQKIAKVLSSVEQKEILKRVGKLLDAIKVAREEANSIDVRQSNVAGPILDYVFSGLGK